MYCSPLPPLAGDADWCVADIGGTRARLACWGPARGLGDLQRWRNDEFASLAALLAGYLDSVPHRPSQALLALALPVTGEQLIFTNRAWSTDAGALARELGLERLVVTNDFVAAAAGAAGMCADALAMVQPGAERGAVRAVLGPGTGLGAAALVIEGCGTRVLDSEAGHMSYAPADEAGWRLSRAARAVWPRVSWERLLCGDGLAWIDAWLHDRTAASSAADVAARAQAGESGAIETARLFSRLLGEFAGDLCLAWRAFGGIYLTGGVLAGLGTAFDVEAFRAGFADKGRFGSLLGGVPCWRIAADDLALQGLAGIARGGIAVPGELVAGGTG